MKRQNRRSPRQWASIVGEQERSGLSVQKFCTSKSIGLTSFYHWRRRVRAEQSVAAGGADSSGSFIDMGQLSASSVSSSSSTSPWVLTLDLGGGVKLTVQRG